MMTQINANKGKALALSIVYRLLSVVCIKWSMVSRLRSKVALSCILCLVSIVSSAQLNYDYTAGKFLIKGKVVDVQTKTPLPFANIIFVKNGKGISCDNDGNFTLYVYPTDTLRFSSTGYLPKVIHMYDIDSTKYYTLEISLMHDFIKMKDVVIYPFKNRDEFIDAFMDAKDMNKLNIAGIAPPKYSNVPPKAKFNNPISFLYEKVKKRRAANPDFKP